MPISVHHRLLWYLTAGLPKSGLLLGSCKCKSPLLLIIVHLNDFEVLLLSLTAMYALLSLAE